MQLKQMTFECESIYDLQVNNEVWIGNCPHFVKQFSRGGMGFVVFLRRDDSRSQDMRHHFLYGPDVAIKTVLPTEDGCAELFQRELAVWSGLIHPNIVRLLEILDTQSDGRVASMIRCPGSLRSLIDKQGHLNVADALFIADDVVSGLDYAIRTHGTLHLDIKPANILFGHDLQRAMEHKNAAVRGYRWQVSDWGLASVKKIELSEYLLKNHVKNFAITLNNLGSFPYMAPERFEAGTSSSIASDMFALGLLLFEMITGELPYDPQGPDVVIQIRSFAYYSQSAHVLRRKAVPKGIGQIILRLLSPDPLNRFSNYSELQGRIRRLMRPESFISRFFKL